MPPTHVIVVDGDSGRRIVNQIAGPYFLDQSNLTLKCIALDGEWQTQDSFPFPFEEVSSTRSFNFNFHAYFFFLISFFFLPLFILLLSILLSLLPHSKHSHSIVCILSFTFHSFVLKFGSKERTWETRARFLEFWLRCDREALMESDGIFSRVGC